jgi:hypothetical protein
MYVDWVRVYGDTTPPPPPPPADGETLGLYSETHTDPTLTYANIINSADWSGNPASPDDESTGVTPREGSFVLSVDYQLLPTPSDWGGIAMNYVDSDISAYSTLYFSLNTSAMAGFDDMEIALEDISGQASKSAVRLASYTPTNSGSWADYAIPLADFTNTNLANMRYLLFVSPVDASDNFITGMLYIDNIYVGQACSSVGEVMLHSALYPSDSTATTITVTDGCAVSSTVAVSVGNGTETISVDVALGAEGNGSSTINFGTTDDGTDTIAIAQGDTLTASYTDANSGVATDTAAIVAAGPLTLTGDDDGDGAVYLYATDVGTVIDLDDGDVDYTAVDDWSSGATLNNAYTGDATYSPAFSVASGTEWDGADAGALAFTGFTAGFASTYDTLHFKYKGASYSSVNVKFSTPDPDVEVSYPLSSVNAAELGNGWYELSIRLSDFSNLASATEFAVVNYGAGTFYVTDIYFE